MNRELTEDEKYCLSLSYEDFVKHTAFHDAIGGFYNYDMNEEDDSDEMRLQYLDFIDREGYIA